MWLAAGIYVVLLTLASVDRHVSFSSGGYDLGIFSQGLWLLGHGDAPFSTIRGRNLFADHFQPTLALLAPLGSLSLNPWAILLFQSVLLAAAAPVLYALALGARAGPPARTRGRLALAGVAAHAVGQPLRLPP